MTLTYRGIVEWLFSVAETVGRLEIKVRPESLNNDAGYESVTGISNTPAETLSVWESVQCTIRWTLTEYRFGIANTQIHGGTDKT